MSAWCRIVFSSDAFAQGTENVITLDSNLPDLPSLQGDVEPVLVVATDDRVTIEPDAGYDDSRRVAFTVYGPAVIHGLRLLEMSRLVEPGVDCTKAPGPGVGSAIAVAGGANAVISGNHFVDTGMAERPCTQALVAATSGSEHAIADNVFEDLPGNAIYVFSSPALVRGNRIVRGLNSGVLVDAPGAVVRVEGNLTADLVYAGLIVYEGSNVEAVNNTFVRTDCDGIQGVSPARLWLRNNVYLGLSRPALAAASEGVNIDAAFEATDGTLYCWGCAQTTVADTSMLIGVGLGLADPTGSTWEAMTPAARSLLLDSGADVSDRNASAVGRYDGPGPDRGAVERPR